MKYFTILAVLLLAVGGFYTAQHYGVFNSLPLDTLSGSPQQTRGGATLDLSNQGLTKIPESVFANTAIVTLDLSHNVLTGALQAEVRKLQNLRELDLSDNNFTGVPAEVGQLKNLEVLDLSNNSLTGLPHEIGNLSNLKVLDLRGNAYSEADLTAIRKNLSSATVVKVD